MDSLREELYSEIAPGLWARKAPPAPPIDALDALIFDIDGVLVDVSDSFPQVLPRAVQFYFNRILKIPGETPLVSAGDNGLFKMAGRYNNDWDVTKGAVAFGLMKLLSLNDGSLPSMEALSAAEPALEEFTAAIGKLGGGLDNTLAYVRERLGSEKNAGFEALFRPEVVRKIFMEHYAGSGLCRTFYGHDPEYYDGPGLYEREICLAELPLIEDLCGAGIGLGILSGRIPPEADYALARMGLDSLLAAGFVILDDGTLPGKPDPAGLRLLELRMGFARGIFVGDTPDDWSTVLNFRKELADPAVISGCLVETGARNNPRLISWFEEARVDYLAADVNCLLKAMQATVL